MQTPDAYSAKPSMPAEPFEDGVIQLHLLRTLGPEQGDQRPPEARFLARSIEYRFAIHRQSDGVRVGRIHLRDTNDSVILRALGHCGYAVDEPYRRQGYATRAVRLICQIARHLRVTPLWILIAPENTASRRTVERAGLQYVDTAETSPEARALDHGPLVCRYLIELS